MSTPEFSRPIDIARLGPGETALDIAATADERAALARRFELVALDRLEAKVKARRVGALIRVTAVLSADLVQSCVVTLEPVASRIADEFTVFFGTAANEDLSALAPDVDPIEPLTGDRIDLGETVAQQLSLAIDPYPRSPAAIAAPAEETAAPSPFAALANWKPRS